MPSKKPTFIVCQATNEKLRRLVDYENDKWQGLKYRYEAELDRCKGQNEETVLRYEKDRKESLSKIRVLEDAATENSRIIDELKKQLWEYQMGHI
jgi:uncharacterized protein YeaO (DUF488 family)